MARIVTIGGGTGAPIVLKALMIAGFSNISAICAAMDSGGKTGVMRSDERDRVIAVSDLLRNLLALSNDLDFAELMSYTDGRGRNLGYTVYYALLEKYDNDYLQVQCSLERLLKTQFAGRAIPVTMESATLCFETESGQVYRGEHELDNRAMSQDAVYDVWIEPDVYTTRYAIDAIDEATHIIYCPGSLYGSIVANFLPQGIREILWQSTARKILITNLVSTRNETHDFTLNNYWDLLQKYTGLDVPFDLVIVPDISRKGFEKQYPDIAERYAYEYSYFLGWEVEALRQFDTDVLCYGIYSITPELGRIRHDPVKLAKALKHAIDD